jgi:uncharacterized delta-60 repeat protein
VGSYTSRSRTAAVAFGAAVLATILLPCIVLAAIGDLDASFGTGGRTTTDFGGTEMGTAVAFQSDGSIIVAGHTSSPSKAFVARYSANGILDDGNDGPGGDGFAGGNGFIAFDWGGSSDQAYSVAVQSDDKIVVAGSSSANFALARLNANGTLDVDDDGAGPDTAFGTGGKLTTDIGATDSANAVAIQSDTKIVAAGASGADFAVARYDNEGVPDPGFDGNGNLTTDFSGGTDRANAIAIQSDGKIVVGGLTDGNFALARLNANGTLDVDDDGAGPDLAFGAGGKVTTDFTGTDELYGLALEVGDKIVAAGRTSAGTNPDNFALARYLPATGALDSSFDGDGKQTTDFGGDESAYGVAIQSDGSINAAGSTSSAPNPNNAAIAHYTSSGSLDGTFSGDGRTTVDFAPSSNEARAIAMQPGKRLLIVGFSGTDVTLARLFGADDGADTDEDGINDAFDNCPAVSNADQANYEGDALGDACDPDDDNDTVVDDADGCPMGDTGWVSGGATDNDHDGCRDAGTEDPDDDNDAVADASDNCSLVANADQVNTDGDTQGDACDPDDDNDGIADAADACPQAFGTAANGCPLRAGPTSSKRGLTLSHSSRSNKFKGTLTADVAACSQGQQVEIFHKVKGPDTKLGTAKTATTGKYSLKKNAPDGSYYGSARQSSTGGVACLAAKSGSVKLD